MHAHSDQGSLPGEQMKACYVHAHYVHMHAHDRECVLQTSMKLIAFMLVVLHVPSPSQDGKRFSHDCIMMFADCFGETRLD